MGYEQFLKSLGSNIRKKRSEAGLTLNRAAQAAFLRWSKLRDIENGTANPTLKTLNKIAYALDIDIDKLFKLEEN